MGSANDADPGLGTPWPSCAFKVVELTLDFGLGDVFQNQGIAAGIDGDGVPWNSGNAEALLRAVAAVKAINEDATAREYGVHTIWTNYCRNIAGTNSPSFHSLGSAIDINPQTNYRGIEGDIPEWMNNCFRDEGFAAGDDWSYSDPMHYENGRFYKAWDGTYPGEEDDLPYSEKRIKELVIDAVNGMRHFQILEGLGKAFKEGEEEPTKPWEKAGWDAGQKLKGLT
jgi:hypothetical protein